jgi:hypothetical protein
MSDRPTLPADGGHNVRESATTPVHRELDGELCGYVIRRGDRGRALTLFEAVLGEHDSRERATEQVRQEGLAVLAERWILRNPRTETEEVVCIVEAHPQEIVVALDFYPTTGTPTLSITVEELRTGAWDLHR